FEFMENNLGFDLDTNDIALSPLAMGGLTYGVTTEEMAAAYAAFVNKGVYNEPRTILKIENNDHTEVIVDNTVKSRVAMRETTAYLMTKLLRNVITSGTGTAANLSNATVAGKTGTTNDARDLYFAGYSGYYSAAVWVGYAKMPEQINYRGASPSALIWAKVMEALHEGLEDKPILERPDGITTVTVCADCGLLPGDLCGSDYRGSRLVTAEIQSSAAPKEHCTCHVEVQICTDPETGDVYLAGEYCPEDTVTTRVMLAGRTYLGIPDGSGVEGAYSSIISAEDDAAHLTYLRTKGSCPIHDENFVPEPDLPGEEDLPGSVPLPGEPGWPTEPFDPNSVLPPENNETQDTGTQTPWNPSNADDPSEPPATDPDEGDANGLPEPEEPILPEEPVLP
ncbi:MAG: hypothetical protein K2N78_00575, partial [Oscillospiraceae bacterium]|nr:hypothetical protein [Oscillospiraceae bacterium]